MTPQEQLEQDVAAWQQLKVWLADAKDREKVLRDSIAARMFASIKQPNGAFKEGTTNLAIPGNAGIYNAKLNSKLNRTILEELLVPTLAEAALTAEEAKGLIRGKPELGLVAYKNLPEEKRRIIDKMLSVKQGAIELDITTVPKA